MAQINIIANCWQCPDGTILQSKHRYDCVTHTDTTTGEFCMVDGGLGYYIRTSGGLKNLCVYFNDPHEKQREHFYWGTRGVDGTEELQWKLLKNLSCEHIEAILDTQEQLPYHLKQLFRNELKYRKTLNDNQTLSKRPSESYVKCIR